MKLNRRSFFAAAVAVACSVAVGSIAEAAPRILSHHWTSYNVLTEAGFTKRTHDGTLVVSRGAICNKAQWREILKTTRLPELKAGMRRDIIAIRVSADCTHLQYKIVDVEQFRIVAERVGPWPEFPDEVKA